MSQIWKLTFISNKAAFLHDQKVKTKIQISWASKMKKTIFFIIYKGLSLKEIKQIFLGGKGPTLNACLKA